MQLLIEQELELHRHQTRQDRAALERLIHPSFCEVGRSGTRYDFASIIDAIGSEAPSTLRLHSQNYECVQLASSVQLLRYESALMTACGEVSGHARRCSIWTSTGSSWQLIYHQGTPCAPFDLLPGASRR